MPLLTPLLARWLPGVALPAAPLPMRRIAALPQAGWPVLSLAWACYGAGAGLMLARLAAGLVLSLRLYRRTVPLAQDRALRIGAAVRSPMVFGRTILLPAEFKGWSAARQAAVLAHEQRHLARGDFFLQLAASLYRAFFWFSPFAWWLQRKLSALAERDSDAAAARRMGDPASYAELLVEAAARAQGLPALVAMAKGPDIAWRVDHILADAEPARAPGLPRRMLAAAMLLGVSLGAAGAHAAPPLPAMAVARLAPPLAAVPSPAPIAAHPTPRPAAHMRAAVRYDPRALLRDPRAVMVRGLLVMTDG
jgi:hypothetical protein